jgi:hypothetical protein
MKTPDKHYRIGISPYSLKHYATTMDVLHKLMLEFDKHEDLDNHAIRHSLAYDNAVKELGWNVDWDEING